MVKLSYSNGLAGNTQILLLFITASIMKKNGCDYSLLMLAKPVTQ